MPRRRGQVSESLELIRNKERQLRELILSAHRVADDKVQEARKTAEEMVSTAEEAVVAQGYYHEELARIDAEAKEVVARSKSQTESLASSGATKISDAIEFVFSCVVPKATRKE